MNTEYLLIIALIAIILLMLVFYNVKQKKIVKTPSIQKYINKDDLKDIHNRNFRSLPRAISNSNMDWYYSDTDKILAIMGTRGGNASFQSGRRYEGFDTINEQSCNEDGCNVIENIDGIFVALENQMFPIKGKLTFGHRVNNSATGVDDVLITNDMNGVGADAEMDDLAGNVMPYGQGNDLLPNNGEMATIPLENVNNLLPDENAMISNNLTNINYPQRNYDNSLIITSPNDVSSNLGIIKKNVYHNGDEKVVEIFRRIG
uniref:Uncharacterized protein n=1 Tax=viral metagenome TaxID=1070528 RepID=A0A6C0C6J6_9ZZZZ